MDKHQSFTIADLADEFNITARTLRFYEDKGLLNPERSGQSRIYSAADRVRVSWILRGKRVGFSLSEVSEMLDLYDPEDGRMKQRQVTLEKCSAKIEELKNQRDDIDIVINDLEEFCTTLENFKLSTD
jgi:DNA-binding transcriptional MerR regulator